MENPEWLTDKTKTDVKQQVNRKYSVTYKLCENSRSLIWLDYLQKVYCALTTSFEKVLMKLF